MTGSSAKMPFSIIALLMILSLFSPTPLMAEETREFAQFAITLPEGWDGDEQTGFISDNPGEYSLTLGKKDDSGDHFLAQISIYLLPNKPKTNSRDAAFKLAEAQGGSSEPEKKGDFWFFTGEPRSNTIKAKGSTMVRATQDDLLIIISQDPQNLGAASIIESMMGLTPRAKNMLGR